MAVLCKDAKSPRSVREIEKSSAPFKSQIADICEILEIRLEIWSSATTWEDLDPTHPRNYGPREEWALRWLLKTLEAAAVTGDSVCLVFQAWLLLYELLVRTTLRNVARLLNVHKFTGILRNTLQQLHVQAVSQANSSDLSTEEIAVVADSSSATVEASSVEEPKKSRKRKQVGSQENSVKTKIGLSYDIGLIYFSICRVIRRLNTLVADSSEGPQGFVVEHLKATLKGPPEQIAEILGVSFLLANIVSNKLQSSIEDHMCTVDSCISSSVEFWRTCWIAADDPSDQPSNEAFSIHCLLPTLYLLATMQGLSNLKRPRQARSTTLEDLIFKKIIIPSRESFLRSKSVSNIEKDDESWPSSIDLLGPLTKVRKTTAGELSVGGQALGVLWPTSIIFRIAVQSLPRVTPKQRSIEDSWLQELFNRLLQHNADGTAPNTQLIYSTQYVSKLNQLLQEIVDHNIRVSVSKLEPLLDHTISCLDGGLDAATFCEMISLCIAIDANIFIVPAPIAKAEQANNRRLPNQRLAAIMLWITTSAWKKSLEPDMSYEAKLTKVVMPLVKAFAKARDLLGFVDCWQEQLAVCQTLRSSQFELVPGSYLPRSLWEDERLLQLVSRLLGSTLTTGQINNTFLKAHANITSHTTLGSDGHSQLIANLILLDCALGITLNDDRSDQIASAAGNIYHSTLDNLLSGPGWPKEHKWRLWRILITYNERWVSRRKDSDLQAVEQRVIDKAADLIARTLLPKPSKIEDRQHDYAEELYAFSFILSATSEQNKVGKDGKQSSHETIAVVFEWLIGYGERERGNEEQEQIASTKNSESVVQWNGQSDAVSTLDILHLGYVSQVLAFPSTIGFTNVMQQYRLFQTIYSGAITFRSSFQTKLKPYGSFSTSVNYLSLWNQLLKIETFKENRTLSRSFRDYVVSIFLETTTLLGSSSWGFDTVDYDQAFRSIQSVAGNTSKGQKEEIFDRVLRILISNGPLSSMVIVDSISLLTRFVEHISHPLVLIKSGLENIEMYPEDGSNEEAPLVVLANKFDNDQGIDVSIALVLALKHLAEVTIKHCISKSNHAQSAETLVSFYQNLVRRLGDGFDPLRNQAFSGLLSGSFNIISQCMGRTPEPFLTEFSRLLSFQQLHIIGLCGIMKNIFENRRDLEQADTRRELGVTLEIITSYSSLFSDFPNVEQSKLFDKQGRRAHAHITYGYLSTSPVSSWLFNILERLSQINISHTRSEPNDQIPNVTSLYVLLVKIEINIRLSDSNLQAALLSVARALRNVKSTRARKSLLEHLQKKLTTLEPERKGTILEILAKAGHDESFGPEWLELLERVILSSSGLKLRHETWGALVTHIYSTLCRRLTQAKHARTSILTIRCMSLFLEKESSSISQWHVDSTLASISITSSCKTLMVQSKHAGMVFFSLCSLFNKLLVVHRMKLGGRYHLIVSALQGLLRCLFISYKNEASISFSNTSEPFALGEAHAAVYGRLLTTICDPTVSAVTRPRKRSRHELNDETRKARNIAGQHLQYLIMEFCECQLQGRLKPEMKAALTPGLHAIFSVMSPDVMRTINAAMNSSSQSIFKALYDDYGRSGRWRSI